MKINFMWFVLYLNCFKTPPRKRSGEEHATVMEEDMRLCSVRPALDQDRRFCFEVISPNKSHMVQADSEESYKSWIQALQVKWKWTFMVLRLDCSLNPIPAVLNFRPNCIFLVNVFFFYFFLNPHHIFDIISIRLANSKSECYNTETTFPVPSLTVY